MTLVRRGLKQTEPSTNWDLFLSEMNTGYRAEIRNPKISGNEKQLLCWIWLFWASTKKGEGDNIIDNSWYPKKERKKEISTTSKLANWSQVSLDEHKVGPRSPDQAYVCANIMNVQTLHKQNHIWVSCLRIVWRGDLGVEVNEYTELDGKLLKLRLSLLTTVHVLYMSTC